MIIYLDDPAISDPDWIHGAEQLACGELMPDEPRRTTFHLAGTANDHDQKSHGGGVGTARRPYEVTSDQLINGPLGRIHGLKPDAKTRYGEGFLKDTAIRASAKFNGPIKVAEQMTMLEHRMITEGLGTYDDSRASNMGSLEGRDAIEWAKEMGLQPGNYPEIPLAVLFQAAHIQKNLAQLSLVDFGEYDRQRLMATSVVDEFHAAIQGSDGQPPRLDGSTQFEEALADLTYGFENDFGVSPAAGFLGSLNRSWAESSQDYLSQAHQIAVANLYGHSFDRRGIPESMGWLQNKGGFSPELAKDLYTDWQPAFDAAAAANYRFTQNQLERQGVGEASPVTVYRGISLSATDAASLDPLAAETNPLSSWTTSPYVAYDFGGGGWVFEAKVPREYVYSTAGISGMGSLPEQEVILTADAPISARVVNRFLDGPLDEAQMLDNIHGELAVRVVGGVTVVHVDAEDADWLKRSGSNDAQFHLAGTANDHDQQSHAGGRIAAISGETTFHLAAPCAVHQFRGCQDASCRPPTSGGTGGSHTEAGQLNKAQRQRYDASEKDHAAAMMEAIHGDRQLAGMSEADDATRKALVVPPNWRYVMVADDPDAGGANGLLMTGIDAAGRVQNRYTAAKTAEQARLKYERTARLAEHTEALDQALAADAMNDPAAAVVQLIRKTGMRVGSTDDTKAKTEAFGASTLEARHVTVNEQSVRFKFTGKKGVLIDITVRDPELVAMMTHYTNGKSRSMRLFDTDGAAANAYLDSHTAPEFKIKDLRTLKANTVAHALVASRKRLPKTTAAFRKMRREVGVAVSQVLGNSPAEALKSYINPALFNAWEIGLPTP